MQTAVALNPIQKKPQGEKNHRHHHHHKANELSSKKQYAFCLLLSLSIVLAIVAIGLACSILLDRSTDNSIEMNTNQITKLMESISRLKKKNSEKLMAVMMTVQKSKEMTTEEITNLMREINSNEDVLNQQSLRIQNLALEACSVGIKDGRIPDSAITASSIYSEDYAAYYGRLDNTGDPRGFWHPQSGQYDGSWLQVDLGSPRQVVGVTTQGRPPQDANEDWVTSYKIQYGNSNSSLSTLQNPDTDADKVFQGNRDRNSKVSNLFPEPITAQYFRIVVVTYNRVPVLRIEYLTC